MIILSWYMLRTFTGWNRQKNKNIRFWLSLSSKIRRSYKKKNSVLYKPYFYDDNRSAIPCLFSRSIVTEILTHSPLKQYNIIKLVLQVISLASQRSRYVRLLTLDIQGSSG